MNNAKAAAALVGAAALAAGLTGCQNESPNSTSQSQYLAVGKTDAPAYKVLITNSSKKTVMGLAVKQPGEDTHSTNMLSSDQRLLNGEVCELYIEKTTSPANGEYLVEIKVTFIDGLVSNLHHVDLEELSECSLLLKGKVGYITYQGKSAQHQVSTYKLQRYYYDLEDPGAAARDKKEAEEEKRRLEKLEEELVSQNTDQDQEAENPDEVQSNDLEDDPLEVPHDAEDEGSDD